MRPQRRQFAVTFACIASCALVCSTGCRRQARNDLYVQHLAAEVRGLEDRIYEFDHEYRLLEDELTALEKENARLKKMLETATSQQKLRGGSGSSGSNDLKSWQDRAGGAPKLTPPPKTEDKGSKESTPESSGENPAPPDLKLNDTPAPPKGESTQGAPPTTAPLKDEKVTPSDAPSLDAPKVTNPMDIKPDQLQPPPIDAGSETSPPPSLQIKPTSEDTLPAPNKAALDVEAGQVRVAGWNSDEPKAAVQPAVAVEPIDKRITEIAFDSSLCLGEEIDGEPGDDGVRLLLQPKNAQGEFVPIEADLLISILDPEKSDETARLGLWRISASEVKQRMSRTGNLRGISITLPFETRLPSTPRVVVFARYEMPDGKKMTAQTPIFLSTPDALQSKWLPRAGSRSEAAE